MTWRDLIEERPTPIVAPWLGGRTLRLGPRAWTVGGRLPPEHGWWRFWARGRTATLGQDDAPVDARAPLQDLARGIPVGDRFVPDGAKVPSNEPELVSLCEPVHLLEDGLEPFQAVYAGRSHEGGPLVYDSPALPDPAAGAVLSAWEDRRRSLDGVRGVTPALDLAFRILWQQRDDAERRREALARAERERLEAEAREARQRDLFARVGSAIGRRRVAAEDFETAARAALAVGGAEYLSHRIANRHGEQVVRFRLEGRRFECICDGATLRIIDAGVCLTDHDTGERGDTWLTLESLPSVIKEAVRRGVLHVFRHVD